MAMRVTSSMMSGDFLRNLYGNMERMSKYQNQLATNKRLTKLSDDPSGAIKSMDARVKLYRLEQYQENVATAKEWLTQAETSLLEMSSLLTNAYENSVQGASDFNNPDDRKAMSELIAQLREHVLDLGNSKMGEHYIFGGYNTNSKPFTLDADGNILYNGIKMTSGLQADLDALALENQQVVQYEVGFGIDTEATVPGTRFMGIGDENIYKIMDDFYTALQNNDQPGISESIGKLQGAQARILALTANVGGRQVRLDMMTDRYETDTLNYTKIKSDVEDVSQAETVMYFKMADAVYTSALQVGSQILKTTLLDYLR